MRIPIDEVLDPVQDRKPADDEAPIIFQRDGEWYWKFNDDPPEQKPVGPFYDRKMALFDANGYLARLEWSNLVQSHKRNTRNK